MKMGEFRFRKHPEIGPAGKVTIAGPVLCSAERMAAYASRRNPRAAAAAPLYVEKARRFGIRGDVAYCQAMLDTGVWTKEPLGPPWRPYAQLIWGNVDKVWTTSEWEQRIERHLTSLADFISNGRRAAEACWEDLNGWWAVPGHRYGQDVVSIWRGMANWNGEGVVHMAEEEQEAEVGVSETRQEDLEWLRSRGWLPEPEPHHGRGVTWGELARVIRHLGEGGEREERGAMVK